MLEPLNPLKTSTCKHCGKGIVLMQTGVRTWKWVDGRMGWHCGSDPAHPTRAHAPGEADVARIIQVADIPAA